MEETSNAATWQQMTKKLSMISGRLQGPQSMRNTAEKLVMRPPFYKSMVSAMSRPVPRSHPPSSEDSDLLSLKAAIVSVVTQLSEATLENIVCVQDEKLPVDSLVGLLQNENPVHEKCLSLATSLFSHFLFKKAQVIRALTVRVGSQLLDRLLVHLYSDAVCMLATLLLGVSKPPSDAPEADAVDLLGMSPSLIVERINAHVQQTHGLEALHFFLRTDKLPFLTLLAGPADGRAHARRPAGPAGGAAASACRPPRGYPRFDGGAAAAPPAVLDPGCGVEAALLRPALADAVCTALHSAVAGSAPSMDVLPLVLLLSTVADAAFLCRQPRLLEPLRPALPLCVQLLVAPACKNIVQCHVCALLQAYVRHAAKQQALQELTFLLSACALVVALAACMRLPPDSPPYPRANPHLLACTLRAALAMHDIDFGDVCTDGGERAAWLELQGAVRAIDADRQGVEVPAEVMEQRLNMKAQQLVLEPEVPPPPPEEEGEGAGAQPAAAATDPAVPAAACSNSTP
eukprot:CAMPEP_0177653500 /NCGR_PEP_ID=MMETSP0447-20121125/13770_1 /TAXON_ID=0 /ORGANISM="Stygamoeba regulata, Strain BSH-02190019" /LENGTH=515 /DNA_ID=CAMNT_0019156963 /DNA_START=255 /DNA_END=1801 /DNA_ORIENTATION=+